MSVLKKLLLGLLVLIVIIFGFVYYGHHQEGLQLKEAFKKGDKLEVLHHLMASERYANDIRKAGYIIPSDASIRREGMIEALEIDGELHLRITQPGDEIYVIFEEQIDGKMLEVFYVLDKQLNLLRSNYEVIKKKEKEDITLSDDEEKNILNIVQSELNNFLDTMYIQLYGEPEQ